MGTERHVAHRALHVVRLLLDLHRRRLCRQQRVPQRPLHAVARDDHGAARILAPGLERLERRARVQHARRGEEHHRVRRAEQRVVEDADVREVEDAAEGSLHGVARPRRVQLVVLVGPPHHACAEVDGHLKLHALPEGFDQDKQLLRPAHRKHRNQHLPATQNRLVHQLQEVPLALPLRVAHGASVRALRDQARRAQPRQQRRPHEVPVARGVVVAGVQHGQPVVLDVEHRCAQDVSRVVRRDAHALDLDGLVETDGRRLGHAVLDVLLRPHRAVVAALHHLAHVLEQQRGDALRGRRHQHRPAVPHLLREEGQGPGVVEVEVRDADAVDVLREVAFCDKGEVGKLTVVVVPHVHAAVHHQQPVADGHHHTGSADLPSGPQRHNLDLRFILLHCSALNSPHRAPHEPRVNEVQIL
eukprot:Rhum_TRINITY_DN4216_c0_g1::Rhum_TRINITY_DN4216_c0_g1_i1::g.13478::m.13478